MRHHEVEAAAVSTVREQNDATRSNTNCKRRSLASSFTLSKKSRLPTRSFIPELRL